MKKEIESVSTKNAGKNGVDYFLTTTVVKVSEIENAQQHEDARRELNEIKPYCSGNSVYSFLIIEANFNSFKAKTFGNCIEELEKIGYTF